MSTQTASDIFQKTPPALVSELFAYLHENEKPLYKATLEAVAKQRKLRPVFIERKPRNERFAWLHDALSRKSSDAIAAHILQIWLVGQHTKLLCDFLDGLGIKHDENGTVEELPSQPDKALLEKTINDLLQNHRPEMVAVYLHAFQTLNETGWTSLDEILASDSRLHLGATAAS